MTVFLRIRDGAPPPNFKERGTAQPCRPPVAGLDPAPAQDVVVMGACYLTKYLLALAAVFFDLNI
jgi:hypothetical protein